MRSADRQMLRNLSERSKINRHFIFLTQIKQFWMLETSQWKKSQNVHTKSLVTATKTWIKDQKKIQKRIVQLKDSVLIVIIDDNRSNWGYRKGVEDRAKDAGACWRILDHEHVLDLKSVARFSVRATHEEADNLWNHLFSHRNFNWANFWEQQSAYFSQRKYFIPLRRPKTLTGRTNAESQSSVNNMQWGAISGTRLVVPFAGRL